MLCGNLNHKQTDSIIQWTKFLQIFNDINVILSASPRNIILLDRTPFSENIWSEFFNRKSVYNNQSNFLLVFLKLYKELIERYSFKYISLEVNSELLADRIFQRNIDRENYINAFNVIYQQNNNSVFNDDFSKILYMINSLKESFNKLNVLLRQYNIDVEIYANNELSDVNTIVNDILDKI